MRALTTPAATAATATASTFTATGLRLRNLRLFDGPTNSTFSSNPFLHHHGHRRRHRHRQLREADKIVDGMDFGELCNEFECISSPSVESTARQLARDILELREGNRALGTFAVSVKYKDPFRSFTGREKYNRPLWATNALEKPFVSVQEMVMLSTSILSIKWTIRGKPKSLIARIGGDLVVKVNSQFTLNQISGQVIKHEEFWDLSASSVIAQLYFWASRRLFSTVETCKDIANSMKNFSSSFQTEKENLDIYPDPSVDPTKFFQRDDNFQRDLYQIALFIAIIYFVVQYLRIIL
ncbi:uncharacterized protein LOC131152969 isoform X4 [Malania oleifera]|uniref:uncharacterized protein LOC131152969 isoform X4 n=1 Tax=Malania oleifera TaxID=397392 RepID=UPI0025AE8B26|nr:uncharacterized protein LOC131152969 isoform X4 [Malania oleifera]